MTLTSNVPLLTSHLFSFTYLVDSYCLAFSYDTLEWVLDLFLSPHDFYDLLIRDPVIHKSILIPVLVLHWIVLSFIASSVMSVKS